MPRHRLPAKEARANGFATAMERHTALFFKRSARMLVVTFDNMKSRETPSPAYPWGFEFLRKHDYSHLGIVMRRRNDWFRHAELTAFFDQLRDERFFEGFDEVVFYGSSMGGYGALAYASATSGARVVAFSPQTSLDPAHVPFETRYRNGYARGLWSGPYLDGAQEARAAGEVMVFYDPFQNLDRLHVERLQQNMPVTLMKMPFAGHNTMRLLARREIMGEVCHLALEGRLTPQHFTRKLRLSRGVQGVARNSLDLALSKGHPRLVLAALERMKNTQPDWRFPKLKREAQAALDASFSGSLEG